MRATAGRWSTRPMDAGPAPVIITDSDHVILSAVQPETVANRLVDEDDEVEDDE